MDKIALGRSNLKVTPLCLGTMTWGNQTAPDAAHRQLDTALDHGVSFLDTAEIYPVHPIRAESIGRTERIIGLWMEKSGRRDELVITTKISGAGQRLVRNGHPITPATIRGGIEGALRRMRTDYIDVYQFHWPNRGSRHYPRDQSYAPTVSDAQQVQADMVQCLEALAQEVRRGTIGHFGLSNETVWGMMQWIALAEGGAGPRPILVQNEYSMMCRQFDIDFAELCRYEDVALTAYAPLAGGLLSGKYQGAARPDGSRIKLSPDLGRRMNARSLVAVDESLDVALKHNLDSVGMAVAWARQRQGVASVVFGASTQDQLERILENADLVLDDTVLADIDAVHLDHPMPF